MKTITIKQPWAHLICSGINDIENRTWKLPEKMKGQRVLIHVSKSADYDCCGSSPFAPLFPLGELNKSLTVPQKQEIVKNSTIRSAIIGSVEIVDCVINHQSIWAEKAPQSEWFGKTVYGSPIIYNWVLANPILFSEPIEKVKGKLSFWDYPMTEDEYMKIAAK